MTDAGEKATLIKEHRNVCRDIDNLNETYEKIPLLKIEQGYYTPNLTSLQNTPTMSSRVIAELCDK